MHNRDLYYSIFCEEEKVNPLVRNMVFSLRNRDNSLKSHIFERHMGNVNFKTQRNFQEKLVNAGDFLRCQWYLQVSNKGWKI